jgi:signal transduction histidine kinase
MEQARHLPADEPKSLPADGRRRLARAERVLACFQRALSHDLPNQLVALQGLLLLLELEEGGRLGAEGRDYLRRLAAVTGRVQDLVATLRAIGRAAAAPGPVEEVTLAELAREAAAEVKQRFPAPAVTYQLRFPAPVVNTYRRPLLRAVVELIGVVLRDTEGEAARLLLGSRATPDGVELSVGRDPESPAPPANGPAAARRAGDPDAAGALTLALVRELVDTWGGTVAPAGEPGPGRRFTILVRPPC